MQQPTQPTQPTDARARLTPMMARVIELICYGASNKQIAYTLGISEQTVKNYVSDIFLRLDVDNRVSAALLWRSVQAEDEGLRACYDTNRPAPPAPRQPAPHAPAPPRSREAARSRKAGVSPEELFWGNVRKQANGCWHWAGPRDARNRPCLTVDHRIVAARRFAWTLHHGAPPDGLCVVAACATVGCVNPAHLRLAPRGADAPRLRLLPRHSAWAK